ncbi:uncharacterized protein LOC141685595 [Apium graveolens]|uniref:uncharacterized protein LOC141685595 n=1 Tax=Apium graveolens TaxID=4045 RepID=UPI003D78D280
MAYGSEAVLPIEVSMDFLRLQNFDPEKSAEGLRFKTDLVEELRDVAHLRVAKYQEKTTQYFNSKVKPKNLAMGDLVLKEAAISMPTKTSKLAPPWEGPYKIVRVVRPNTFLLAHLDGSIVLNTWNAAHLKKFYP